MKRIHLYFASILWITFYSCYVEHPETTHPQQLPGNIYARGILTNENLPEGSTALFNTSGSIQITNEIFQLTNGQWCTDKESIWDNDITDSTFLTVLYPIFSGHVYSTETLYAGNELEDVLIAQDTLLSKTDIQLEFNHLFSKLTIHLDESIMNTVESISITTPKQVSSINPTTGTYTLNNTPHTTLRTHNNTSDYHFLIPPDKDCSLTLTILTSEDEFTHTLNPHTFQSGYEYLCNVSKTGTRPGIRTAEDFILFSQLINADPLSPKILSQFGDTIDGKMTYRLLADINFEGVDCTELSYIGHSDQPFGDIFDGEGHTISNLEVIVYDGTTGLFGVINPSSTIQNLHLDNCCTPTIKKSSSQGAGLLVGLCYGTVTNCSVTHGSITDEIASPTGGLVGTINGGTVSNCYVTNTTISSIGYTGCIAARIFNGGNIINTYSSLNTNSTPNTTHSGGFCGQIKNGSIINCYVYKISQSSNYKGQLVGYAETCTLSHCYYNLSEEKRPLIYQEKGTNVCESSEQFTSDFVASSTSTSIVKLLNEWIAEKAYTSWKEDESGTLPAIFE